MSVATLPLPAQFQTNSAVVLTGDPQQTIDSFKNSTPRVNEEHRDWREVDAQAQPEPSVSTAGVPPGRVLEGTFPPTAAAGFWKEPVRFAVSESARHLLTDRVRDVLTRLEPVLTLEAQKSHMPLHKMEVSGFPDPEADRDEIVITQWVNVSFEEALYYWERLGLAIERWTESLSRPYADIVTQRIAIEVRSSVHGG